MFIVSAHSFQILFPDNVVYIEQFHSTQYKDCVVHEDERPSHPSVCSKIKDNSVHDVSNQQVKLCFPDHDHNLS